MAERARLELEILEDRVVPSTTSLGPSPTDPNAPPPSAPPAQPPSNPPPPSNPYSPG